MHALPLSKKIRWFIIIASLFLASCSYHEYDHDNPEPYLNYWCTPEYQQGFLGDEDSDQNDQDKLSCTHHGIH